MRRWQRWLGAGIRRILGLEWLVAGAALLLFATWAIIQGNQFVSASAGAV